MKDFKSETLNSCFKNVLHERFRNAKLGCLNVETILKRRSKLLKV